MRKHWPTVRLVGIIVFWVLWVFALFWVIAFAESTARLVGC